MLLNNGSITYYYSVKWLPDSRHIVFGAIEPGRPIRDYIQDTRGGDPRPASSTDPGPDTVFFPDGASYVRRRSGTYIFFDNSRRETLPIASITDTEYVVQAAADGHSVFV